MGFAPGLETEGLTAVLHEFDRSLDIQLHADPSTLPVEDDAREGVTWILFDADRLGIAAEAGVAVLRERLPQAHIVVFGRTELASEIDGLLRRGASAFVPRRFAHDAVLAVLALVKSGERFRPALEESSGGDRGEYPRGAAPSRTLQEFGLTKAERQVLVLVAQGKTNLQIALELGKREGTVRVQMSSILEKLKVPNRAVAILVAMRDPSMIDAQMARVQERPLDLDWLYPHMEFRRHRAGDVLFRKGDLGREMFVVQRGSVSLTQLGLEMRENDIFGEIAIFAPNHRRTSTAVCATDTDLFVLDEDQVRQMHYVNPAFALTVLQLITNRLLADRQRLR
ncbi:MAG: cyclic nucleotide-binding domain-containing protein [Burkholderiales bacterium]|nr:cyclic nucleotide-binding domain-containing protein [Burkholderiales bacterium]